MNAKSASRPIAVSLEHIDGQWAVQIVENGETIQRLFEEEQFARNYAAGQRARLRLPPMDAEGNG